MPVQAQRTSFLFKMDVKTTIVDRFNDSVSVFSVDRTETEINHASFLSYGLSAGISQELGSGLFIYGGVGLYRNNFNLSMAAYTDADTIRLLDFFDQTTKYFLFSLPFEISHKISIAGVSNFTVYLGYSYFMRIGSREKFTWNLSPEYSDGITDSFEPQLITHFKEVMEPIKSYHSFSVGLGLNAWDVGRFTIGLNYTSDFTPLINEKSPIKPSLILETSLGVYLSHQKKKKTVKEFDPYEIKLIRYY